MSYHFNNHSICSFSWCKSSWIFSITKVNDNSYTFPLVTAATVAATGGGFEGFAGPVNTRA